MDGRGLVRPERIKYISYEALLCPIMTNKDYHSGRIHRRGDGDREPEARAAGSGRRVQARGDEPRERMHRVYPDVRIRAHHTNAELKMMRERTSGPDDPHRRI